MPEILERSIREKPKRGRVKGDMVNKKERVWWEEEREGEGGRVNLSPQELFILRATESPYFPKPRNVRNSYIVANF